MAGDDEGEAGGCIGDWGFQYEGSGEGEGRSRGAGKGTRQGVWEQEGWGGAQEQGRTERQGKFRIEQHEPKYEPWEGCIPQSGRGRNCQPAQG